MSTSFATIIVKHYTVSFFVARKLNLRTNCGACLPLPLPRLLCAGPTADQSRCRINDLRECTSNRASWESGVVRRARRASRPMRGQPLPGECSLRPCPRKLAGAALRAGGEAGASQCYVLRGSAAQHIADSPAFAASPLKREMRAILCAFSASQGVSRNIKIFQGDSRLLSLYHLRNDD